MPKPDYPNALRPVIKRVIDAACDSPDGIAIERFIQGKRNFKVKAVYSIKDGVPVLVIKIGER